MGSLKVFLEHPDKFYFHYPFPVSIVGAVAGGRVNFMSAAWHMQLSFKPPLYAVAISPKRYTNELLQKTDCFSVGFLKPSDYEIAGSVGRTSGWEIDKVKAFGLSVEKGKVLEVPILEAAIATYECKIYDRRTYGDHVLYVGEIVGVHFDDEFYTGDGARDLLLYLGNDIYTGSKGEEFRVRFGKEEVGERLKRQQGVT